MIDVSIGVKLLAKILEEESYNYLQKIERKLFVDEEQRYYDYIIRFTKSFNKLPSLKTFFEDNEIDFTPIEEPLEYYYQRVVERYKRNYVISRIKKINKILTDNDIDKLIKEFKTIVDHLDENNFNKESYYSYKELLEMSLEESKKQRDKIISGITTGWKTLDNALNGFNKGNLYVVLARVKMGKSAVLIRMSRHAYKSGHKVLFFSLEMPAIEIADRLLGMEFNINKTKITKGRLSSFTEMIIEQELSYEEYSEQYTFIDGKFTTTIDDVIFITQKIKPDIVFIDGAYLLRAHKRFNAKWELVTYTAEQLKFLAMNLQIPIVASYQFNRNISRKSESVSEKGFENIGLSDAISQLTSAGIALLKPDESDNTREIEIFGSRDGGETKFTINWDWENMNFDEIGGKI